MFRSKEVLDLIDFTPEERECVEQDTRDYETYLQLRKLPLDQRAADHDQRVATLRSQLHGQNGKQIDSVRQAAHQKILNYFYTQQVGREFKVKFVSARPDRELSHDERLSIANEFHDGVLDERTATHMRNLSTAEFEWLFEDDHEID